LSWHHVAALMIACLMVVACVWIVAGAPAATGGREMFFGVVQLANTIASGVAGMALGAGVVMRTRRDLTGHPDREKLGHPPKT
jgi:uncharacterized membrane protein YozB (DUF420 family)